MQFGLLSYSTYNLGDFIQSIAARKFLPRVDRYLDREALDEVTTVDGQAIKVIMNAWFCHHPEKWPPSRFIEPLLISVHIANYLDRNSNSRAREQFARSPEVLQYLRQHGPVGARDLDTLAWLQSLGIESYFSGCLTLTLDRPSVSREPLIVLNDLPAAVVARIQGTTNLPIRGSSNMDHTTVGIGSRFERAEALVDLYATASCVVTSRLHTALPCLAMGTPILLVEGTWEPYRFDGLRELVHHCSVEDVLSGGLDYDVSHPPANPTTYLSIRKELERSASAFART